MRAFQEYGQIHALRFVVECFIGLLHSVSRCFTRAERSSTQNEDDPRITAHLREDKLTLMPIMTSLFTNH